MRKTLVFLITLLISNSSFAESSNEPQQILDAYFAILTNRDISNISSLMDEGNMVRLKSMMDAAMQSEVRQGGTRLQNRFFEKALTRTQIEAIPASYYLERIAGEILQAANMQRFFIARRDILGQIKESDDKIHYVVRLHMEQGDRTTSELQVYTLIRNNNQWKLEFPPIIKQTLGVLESNLLPASKS